MQVSWQPAPPIVIRGLLHLEAPKTAADTSCGLIEKGREMIGWYRTARKWKDSSGRTRVDSGPTSVAGGRSQLRIGPRCTFDAGGTSLTITAVSAHGFWGQWTSDMGFLVEMDTATGRVLPAPSGFFCALRTATTQPPN